LEAQPWRKKLTSNAAWADAASYTVADLTMLRRELAIGYLVAGLLSTLVPVHVWNTLFIHGHGFWTSLENVVVGPFIAVIGFVCSVGNVPLAVAFWKGGISFGGVISFVFADLITFPLLLIYRKYYGRRLTARILVVFWAVMAAGGTDRRGPVLAPWIGAPSSALDGGAHPLPVELHHVPEHRFSGGSGRVVLAVPQP
jgi:hypothetical protein